MNEFHEEEEQYFCRFTLGQFVSIAILEIVAFFFIFYLGARYGPDLFGTSVSGRKEELLLPDEIGKEAPPEIKYTYPDVLTRKGEERPDIPTTLPPPPEPPPPPAPPVPSVPATAPAEARAGNYTVQVGSYQNAGSAAEVTGRWQAKGYDAYMSTGEVPGKGTWYRIRIGSFKTKEGARNFLQLFNNKEKMKAIIVKQDS